MKFEAELKVTKAMERKTKNEKNFFFCLIHEILPQKLEPMNRNGKEFRFEKLNFCVRIFGNGRIEAALVKLTE